MSFSLCWEGGLLILGKERDWSNVKRTTCCRMSFGG